MPTTAPAQSPTTAQAPATAANSTRHLIPDGIPTTAHRDHTAERVAMPLGGLGGGCFLLQANGGFSGWSLKHRPDLLREPIVFASLAVAGGKGWARILQGPTPDWRVMLTRGPSVWSAGGQGAPGQHFGLPAFTESEAFRAFPLQESHLSDDRLPVKVSVGGWSPFIPGDTDATSLPVAYLEYAITNDSASPLDLVFGFHSAQLLTGDPKNDPYSTARRIPQGVVLDSRALPTQADGTPGTLPERPDGSFSITIPESEVKVDAAWLRSGWFDTQTELWRRVSEARHAECSPFADGDGERGASVTSTLHLAPGETRTMRVQLAWYVPELNARNEWQPTTPWYANRFPAIDALIDHAHAGMTTFRERTLAFTTALHGCDLPREAIDAVASNLAILKSPTLLRVTDGRIWGWEGCHDDAGSCHGSCTHVYNYAQALADLFPDLERSLREGEFIHSQYPDGGQMFRQSLPPDRPLPEKNPQLPACDGQLGGLIKLYRDWRRCGDTDWLRSLWPQVRSSLEFCIRTWDPKRDGHLAEPHHNTYDIEFWGEDPLCTTFYCGALSAGIAMAKALGEDVADWPAILTAARGVLRSHCFNGRYLKQNVRWKDLEAKDPTVGSLGHQKITSDTRVIIEKEGPKYQHGEGLLADALLAAWMARHAGLDPVIDEDLELAHLDAIVRHNVRESLRDHACPQRPGYALHDEGGMVMCTWPDGGRPTMPFVYSDELWTGIEYQVANHLITLGRVEEGMTIVRLVRARYDGRRRNPYNEIECGHFYTRALASYGLIQALSGARYDAVDKVLHLTPRIAGDFSGFFAHGSAWGRIGVRNGKPFVELSEGKLAIERIDFTPMA
jgi:uncharacterized protein (DUF608 family)